jgi:hypothetical protein
MAVAFLTELKKVKSRMHKFINFRGIGHRIGDQIPNSLIELKLTMERQEYRSGLGFREIRDLEQAEKP